MSTDNVDIKVNTYFCSVHIAPRRLPGHGGVRTTRSESYASL